VHCLANIQSKRLASVCKTLVLVLVLLEFNGLTLVSVPIALVDAPGRNAAFPRRKRYTLTL
jgi:hypothetical protein